MNTLLLALQLLVADTSNLPYPYAIHAAFKTVEWKKMEAKVPVKYRDSVINTFRVRYQDYFNSPEYTKTDKFYNSFHFIHLNDDQLPDLVYQGWSGGEGNYTFIYYNHGIAMEEIFSDYNDVIDLKFTGKNLSALVIYRFGCCGGTVETERHYRVDSALDFHLVRQRGIIVGMNGGREYVAPDEYFQQPIHFKTINNDYAMRFSPEITSKPPNVDDPAIKGNIIAMFPKGASGIAWARKTDATGREWWLVEMEPQSFLDYTIYYNEDDKPTWYYGWMSSRFLERIQ